VLRLPLRGGHHPKTLVEAVSREKKLFNSHTRQSHACCRFGHPVGETSWTIC